MKLLTKTLFICILSVTWVSTAYSAGGTGLRTLTNVAVTEDGFVRLQGDSDWGNPDSCTRSDFIWVDPSSNVFKEMTAMAYTAKAAGQQIKAFVDQCLSRNGQTYPIIKTLNIE